MVGVARDFEYHLVPSPLPWTGTSSIRPGYSEPIQPDLRMRTKVHWARECMGTQEKMECTPNRQKKQVTSIFHYRETTSSLEQQRDPGTIATISLPFYECFTFISNPQTDRVHLPTSLGCSPHQLLRDLLLPRAEQSSGSLPCHRLFLDETWAITSGGQSPSTIRLLLTPFSLLGLCSPTWHCGAEASD